MSFSRPLNTKSKIVRDKRGEHCVFLNLEKRAEDGRTILCYQNVELDMTWIRQQPATVKGECTILKMLGVGRISNDCFFICESCPRTMMGWSNKCVLDKGDKKKSAGNS